MKTRVTTMAVLLLSGLFAASCAATSPPVSLEQEEELTVSDAFLDRAGPGTSTMDILDREYGEALTAGHAVLVEQEEELTVDDVFRDRAGPGTSTIDFIDQEYGEALRGGARRVEN
jgi:hypothetical protein